MFNNLIESSSHTREFQRRGSFFLFTVAAYVLLFTTAGVASIYAYDAQLDQQTEEIITMLRPVDFPAPPKPQIVETVHNPRPASGDNNGITERQALVARTDMPQLAPHEISTRPNTELPIPHGQFAVTGRDRDTGSPLGRDNGTRSGTDTGPSLVQITEIPPPPPEIRKPVPQVLRKNIINGEAVELPKPPYPQLAKMNHIQGMVSVQVLIDESGKVIAAHAVSGSAFLSSDAVKAAYRARFSPTKIGDQPVKVSGTITYNFVLQP